MTPTLEFRRVRPVLIFEVEDRFARDLGLAGPHPHATGPFQFFVVAQVVGGNRQPMEPLELEVIRNPGGFYLFFGITKTERVLGNTTIERGPDTRGALGPGTYIVRVTSPLYQTGEVEVVL